MKKLLSILLISCMLLGLLVGCGNGGEAGNSGEAGVDGDVVITFAGWGSLAEKKVFQKMIDAFEETHEGITVNFQHYPGGKSNYIMKMIANLAGGRMPDAFYIPTENYAEWAGNNRLLDLTDYLEKSKNYKEGVIWEEALNMYHYNSDTKSVGEDGGLYALPKDLSVQLFAYNKTLFEEKGVPLPSSEVPMTWTEYIDLAKKLTSGSGPTKVYGTCSYILDMAVWANGANFLSEDKKTVTVDTPEFAEALQWVADMSLVHGVAPSVEDKAATTEYERWTNGTLAMQILGPWDQAIMWEDADFEWDVMPIPVNEKTGKSIAWKDSAALCVSASTKKADAAYELIEFLAMNEEAQTINYESGQAIPNIIEMAENDFIAMEKMPINRKLFLDYLKDDEKHEMRDTFYTQTSAWYDHFSTEVTAVYRGDISAAEFCKKIQPEMQKMLDESGN